MLTVGATNICPLLDTRETDWPQVVCPYLPYVDLLLSFQSASCGKFLEGFRPGRTCERPETWVTVCPFRGGSNALEGVAGRSVTYVSGPDPGMVGVGDGI